MRIRSPITKLPAKEITFYEQSIRQTGDDKIARRAFERYQATQEEEWKALIEERTLPILHENAVQRSLDCLYYPEFELAKVSDGFLDVGTPLMDGKVAPQIPIRLGKGDLERGVYIGGATGSGKSVLITSLESQAMDMGYICWDFCVEDDEVKKPLLALNPEMRIIDAGRGQDRLNIYEPPTAKHDLRSWVLDVTQENSKYLHFSDGTVRVITKAVLELAERLGGHPPSLLQLRSHMEREYQKVQKSRAGYRILGHFETSLRYCDQLIFEFGQETVSCNHGYDFKRLTENSVRFVIRDLSEVAQNIYRSVYMLKLMHYKFTSSNDKKHLLILDEATSLLPRKADRNTFSDTYPLAITIINRGRKRGIHCIIASQQPSFISSSALSMGCSISFALNSEKDCYEMYGPLGLNSPEQREELRKLMPRCFLINRHAVFPKPVRGYTHDFPIGL